MRLPINGTERNDGSGIWLLVAAALLGSMVFLFGLYASSFGRFMPAVHGDWANHAATTRAIFLGEDFGSLAIRTTLNEFVNFPKLTYVAAASLAHAFGMSPIQGLSVIVQLSIIIACLFYGLRLVAIGVQSRPSALSAWILALTAFILFIGSHWLRIGFRDQVISNSFISQAASLALANIFLFAALRLKEMKWLIGLMVLAAWALINTHLAGFTWCGLSMILMAFGLPGAGVRARILTAVAGAVIFGLFLVTSPGAAEVLRLAGTGGDLRVFKGQNLSDFGWAFALFIGFYALTIVAMIMVCKRSKDAYRDLVWNTSGFLALGPLILAASVTVLSKGGNWYPVMKWVYVYFPELLIAFLFIVSRRNAVPAPEGGQWPRPILVVSAFVVAFLVQEPYMSAQMDLEPAILAGQGNPPPAQEPRRYPALHVDHPAVNYFIARSVLKIPMDGETFAWMGNGRISESDLGPVDFQSIAPIVQPREVIRYQKGQSNAQRTLTNHWWQLEQNHVWAANAPARIFFIAAKPPATLLIDFVPFLPNGPGLRKFSVTVNGTKMPDMSASAMDWSQPASYAIAVPPGLVKQDGRVAIEVSWVPDGKDDLGFALVAIEYK